MVRLHLSFSFSIHEFSDAGIQPPPSTVHDFMASVSSRQDSPDITFEQFRNFFILLPRKVSPTEIYRYYEMRRYLGDDGRGSARVNMEGMPVSNYFYARQR